MKQVKVTTYEYTRTEKDSFINIPEEPVYFFQTGIRRAVRIIPERDETGEVYSLHVTCVYQSFENRVESFDVLVHTMGEMISSYNKDQYNVARLLLNPENRRTKDQFDSDLCRVLSRIDERLVPWTESITREHL